MLDMVCFASPLIEDIIGQPVAGPKVSPRIEIEFGHSCYPIRIYQSVNLGNLRPHAHREVKALHIHVMLVEV